MSFNKNSSKQNTIINDHLKFIIFQKVSFKFSEDFEIRK